MPSITLQHLQALKSQGEVFSCLTCYDATSAAAMEQAGIDTILVGDSLGMVVQGNNSTLPVTVQDMVYHTRAVTSANTHALIMTDMPFMSYATPAQALHSAQQLMQAGAHVLKLEGGAWLAPTVTALLQNGVPSCVHLGLTPQSVNVLGGYRLQGKTKQAEAQLLADCDAVVAAGAALLLLECVPTHVAYAVQQRYPAVPVIGIGAGANCDGQVLVMHDMLGLGVGKKARFVHDFLQQAAALNPGASNLITEAFKLYHSEVKAKNYPQPQHAFVLI